MEARDGVSDIATVESGVESTGEVRGTVRKCYRINTAPPVDAAAVSGYGVGIVLIELAARQRGGILCGDRVHPEL